MVKYIQILVWHLDELHLQQVNHAFATYYDASVQQFLILQHQSVQWTVLHTRQLLVTLSAAVCAEETGSPGGWWRSTVHRHILVSTLLHLSDHTKQWLNNHKVQTYFFCIQVDCSIKLPIGQWIAATFNLLEDLHIQELENESEGQHKWIYSPLS